MKSRLFLFCILFIGLKSFAQTNYLYLNHPGMFFPGLNDYAYKKTAYSAGINSYSKLSNLTFEFRKKKNIKDKDENRSSKFFNSAKKETEFSGTLRNQNQFFSQNRLQIGHSRMYFHQSNTLDSLSPHNQFGIAPGLKFGLSKLFVAEHYFFPSEKSAKQITPYLIPGVSIGMAHSHPNSFLSYIGVFATLYGEIYLDAKEYTSPKTDSTLIIALNQPSANSFISTHFGFGKTITLKPAVLIQIQEDMTTIDYNMSVKINKFSTQWSFRNENFYSFMAELEVQSKDLSHRFGYTFARVYNFDVHSISYTFVRSKPMNLFPKLFDDVPVPDKITKKKKSDTIDM